MVGNVGYIAPHQPQLDTLGRQHHGSTKYIPPLGDVPPMLNDNIIMLDLIIGALTKYNGELGTLTTRRGVVSNFETDCGVTASYTRSSTTVGRL